METKNKFINKNTLAIFVCWIVYTCSYIGKLGYNANITQIESEFGITHAESGSVGTIFFFAYGAGQIINGIFCKKYNLKYTVFFSLLISSVCNFVLPFLNKFAYFKYIWLITARRFHFCGRCSQGFYPSISTKITFPKPLWLWERRLPAERSPFTD